MGVTIKKGAGAGAPEVADGLALLRFDGMQIVAHKDWAKESDAYGKPDDGNRIHFGFTLLDQEDGSEVYGADGDPIEVEALTRVAFGEKSGAYALLKGIMTPKELAILDDPDQELDSDQLNGRIVQGIIEHSKSGWPQVDSVMPATKAQQALARAAG